MKKTEDCQKVDGGEILGYGRNIFMGYLNRDNDTKVKMKASSTYSCQLLHRMS